MASHSVTKGLILAARIAVAALIVAPGMGRARDAEADPPANAAEPGLPMFRKLVLRSGRVQSLASGDLIEKDWGGERTRDARHDAELIVGADASGPDQLSVWFNHYDDIPIFGAHRSYGRSAPNSVLCLAADSLSDAPTPSGSRLDVVTGTAIAGDGNLFVWFTHGTRGNEGYLGGTYSRAYRTLDGGDVQAVRTRDVVGGPGIDIVAGTRSPTTGRGTLEIWRSDDAPVPSFARAAVYPGAGGEESLGEVTSIQLLGASGQDRPDLVVGTRSGDTAGEVVVFEGAAGLETFRRRWSRTFPSGSVTALVVTDYDLDQRPDLVIALRTGSDSGELQFWRGGDASEFVFDATVTVSGIPIALVAADLGGAANPDIAVGYRRNMNGFSGGVRIHFMDGGAPGPAVDPSDGAVTDMVPAIVCDHFDTGAGASAPASNRHIDLAAGLQSGPTTGALVVFVR